MKGCSIKKKKHTSGVLLSSKNGLMGRKKKQLLRGQQCQHHNPKTFSFLSFSIVFFKMRASLTIGPKCFNPLLKKKKMLKNSNKEEHTCKSIGAWPKRKTKEHIRIYEQKERFFLTLSIYNDPNMMEFRN